MSNYRLVYNRYFDSKSECRYNGKIVLGVDIDFLFSFYDENGKEIFYKEGEECLAQEKLHVRLDKQYGIKFSVQSRVGESISVLSAMPVKFYIDIYKGEARNYIKDCPKEIEHSPVCEFIELPRAEFIKFIRDNWNCFDTSKTPDTHCTAVRYEPVVTTVAKSV